MAAVLGTSLVDDSDGTVSSSVTVPSGTQYVLAFATGWNDPARTVSAMTIGGTSLGAINSTVSTTGNQGYLRGAAFSTTGSQTFAVTWSGSFAEGGRHLLVYLDADITVIDSDTNVSGSNPGTMNLTLDSQSGDLALAFGGGWNGSTAGLTTTGASQTNVLTTTGTGAFNSDHIGCGSKVASGATVDLEITGDYPGMVGVVVRDAAGGGGGSTHHIHLPLLGVG